MATHRVLLDQQPQGSLVVVVRDGGVRPDDGLALVIEQGLGVGCLGQESRGDLASGDRLGIGEGEGVAGK